MRDYNGTRGAVPTPFRAHDWQTCRLLREAAEAWISKRRLREAMRRLERRGWRVTVRIEGRRV